MRRGNEDHPEFLAKSRIIPCEQFSNLLRSALSSPRVFIILLIVEVCFLYLLRWPLLYKFNSFAFWDSGSYLVAHYLLQQGHQPFSYFGWQYGLLPLFIQELGFHLLGATPASFLCLSVPCVMTVAVVMGRIALRESGTAGRILVILSLPLMLAFLLDMPHSLEPALLSLGLLSQAKGQYGRAMAFATAACFTKPSMGYFYGLVLLSFVFLDPRELMVTSGARNSNPGYVWSRGVQTRSLPRESAGPRFSDPRLSVVPAICTAFGLSLLLSIVFGWKTVLRSLLPLSGARAYRALHLGWSGVAKELLYFPGVKPGYYIGTPVAFWVTATVYLMVAAAATWAIARSRAHRTTNREMILTCAILHLGFIALFYGFPASWTYYAYILVAGIIATQTWPPGRMIIGVLCVLAVLANYSEIREALSAWKTMRTNASTAGLFAVSDESAEWNYVISLAKHGNPALFTNFGEAQLLFPWFSAPAGAFIIPGVATNGEIVHERQKLRTAHTVIVPTIPELGNALKNWPGPEFSDVLNDATLEFKGTYFQVYKRRTVH
ncbi:MAG: hypothetical protein JO189_15115 [Deltaproteobacteria bacterium]|nr:hypothetical protein [Deltaproteobacteria bacterium]